MNDGDQRIESVTAKLAAITDEARTQFGDLTPQQLNWQGGLDLSKTIITSPLLGVVTYSLDDCLTIFVLHSQRHVGQARRVAVTPGFN